MDDNQNGQVDEGATCGAVDVDPGAGSSVDQFYLGLAAGATVTLETRNMSPLDPAQGADSFMHLWSNTRVLQASWDDDSGSCAYCSKIIYTNNTGTYEQLTLFTRGYSYETRGNADLYQDGVYQRPARFGGRGVAVSWQSGADMHLRLNPGGSTDTILFLLNSSNSLLLAFDDDSGPGYGSKLTMTYALSAATVWASQYSSTVSGGMTFYPNYLGVCSDTDSDGLQNVLDSNASLGLSPSQQDSDGDALRDYWEWDGVNNIALYQLGVRPGRKDILLENDYGGNGTTHNHRITSAVASRLQQLYLTLPIPGTEPGFQGVQLGIVNSSEMIDETYADVCTTGTGNINKFLAFRDPGKTGVFHWAVGLHGGPTGQGDFKGDRFVYASPAGAPIGGVYTDSEGFYVYALVAHELGHNLGLGHSGEAQDPNCEPNYPSLMNYAYDYNFVDATGTGCSGYSLANSTITFSRGLNSSINENSLTDTSGVPPTPLNTRYLLCYNSDNQGGNFYSWNSATGEVDWNKNGSYSTSAAAIDVTTCGSSALQVLTDNADHTTIASFLGQSLTAPGHCANSGPVGGDSDASDEVMSRGRAASVGKYPAFACGRIRP